MRVVVLAALCSALAGCGPAGRSPVSEKAEQVGVADKAEKVYSRDEFRGLVVGKTPDEVIRAVGRPDKTSGADSRYWSYRERTRDPITGKTDGNIMVVFENGAAARVVY